MSNERYKITTEASKRQDVDVPAVTVSDEGHEFWEYRVAGVSSKGRATVIVWELTDVRDTHAICASRNGPRSVDLRDSVSTSTDEGRRCGECGAPGDKVINDAGIWVCTECGSRLGEVGHVD